MTEKLDLEQLARRAQGIYQIIQQKEYGIFRVDGTYNLGCYHYTCTGIFSDVKREYDFDAVNCSESHYKYVGDTHNGWMSLSRYKEEDTAQVLHQWRGTKEDHLKQLHSWLEKEWQQTPDYQQQLQRWMRQFDLKLF